MRQERDMLNLLEHLIDTKPMQEEVKEPDKTTWFSLGWEEIPNLKGFQLQVPEGSVFDVIGVTEDSIQFENERGAREEVSLSDSFRSDDTQGPMSWKLFGPDGKEVQVNKNLNSNESVEIQPEISDPPAAQNPAPDAEPSIDMEGNGDLQDPDNMPDEKKRTDIAREVDDKEVKNEKKKSDVLDLDAEMHSSPLRRDKQKKKGGENKRPVLKDEKEIPELVKEARMSVDYVKSITTALKTAKAALKDKDYEAAKAALEDVADDAQDAAKATTKIAREESAKEEAAKEKEPVGEGKVKETVYPTDYFLVRADWKDIDGMVNSFIKAIQNVFQGHVVVDPSSAGTDDLGYVVSKHSLSPEDVRNVTKECIAPDGTDDAEVANKKLKEEENDYSEIAQELEDKGGDIETLVREAYDIVKSSGERDILARAEAYWYNNIMSLLIEEAGRYETSIASTVSELLGEEIDEKKDVHGKLEESKQSVEPYYICKGCGKVFNESVEVCLCSSKLIECVQIDEYVEKGIAKNAMNELKSTFSAFLAKAKEQGFIKSINKEDVDNLSVEFSEMIHGEAKRQGMLENWVEGEDDAFPELEESVTAMVTKDGQQVDWAKVRNKELAVQYINHHHNVPPSKVQDLEDGKEVKLASGLTVFIQSEEEAKPEVEEMVDDTGDEYVATARGLDQDTADNLAAEKGGTVAPDDEDDTKFKVLLKKEL